MSGPKRKRGALEWLRGANSVLDAGAAAALARLFAPSGESGSLPEVLATGR